MCLPEIRIAIAVFGKSCTGKSTVADELGELLGAQVRHCGELLKSRARQLGVSVTDLPVEVHESIDVETCAWTTAGSDSRIVEGSFLDEVLRGLEGVTFVQLVCDDEVREGRLLLRGASLSIHGRDRADDQLREVLYQARFASAPVNMIEVDTTHRSSRETAEAIVAWMRRGGL